MVKDAVSETIYFFLKTSASKVELFILLSFIFVFTLDPFLRLFSMAEFCTRVFQFFLLY